MRLSGMLWWIGAFVFAAVAGLLTYGVLTTKASTIAQATVKQNTRPVVVAAVDIPFRRSIGEGELVIVNLPADSVPEGAAKELNQVVGKMSTVDLHAKEPIIIDQLVTPDIVTQQVALSVPKGKIVMAVPTDSKLIANRLMRPGDHIDLMATFNVEVIRNQGKGPMAESIAMLQNLEVHAIILPLKVTDKVPVKDSATAQPQEEGGVFQTPDERGQSVLLALDPQDALTVRHVLDVGGKLDLALRAPGDDGTKEAVAVDQFYLAKRYQINLDRSDK
ncbi:MAG: Flp pilus assembly protein CpaB [Caldilineaceae bacterium]